MLFRSQLYKNQAQNIARLNHVISEAEAERARQRKDYEMVINERDILGNQLIKRTDELHLLYEKIKIQQSGLAKGKIKYQQVNNTVNELRDEISQTKKDTILAKGEVKCIDELKKESISLYKEVQEERLKASILNEELKKKMNYHKWKELEGKDPVTYNMIMKINSLQRRLIAKTEELAEKDVLIKEKETLYVELKNILAKQSGPEVAEKLEVYQQNLKERMNQLKQYMKELQAYQAQVNAYKYEIERIDKEINGLKQEYFHHRRKEGAGMPPEPIPEEDEGGDMRQNNEPQEPDHDEEGTQEELHKDLEPQYLDENQDQHEPDQVNNEEFGQVNNDDVEQLNNEGVEQVNNEDAKQVNNAEEVPNQEEPNQENIEPPQNIEGEPTEIENQPEPEIQPQEEPESKADEPPSAPDSQ